MTELQDVTPEINAMADCYNALRPLDPNARQRVLNWTVAKLNDIQRAAEAAASTPAAPQVQQQIQPGFGHSEPAPEDDQLG
jgi:hypothetical protein